MRGGRFRDNPDIDAGGALRRPRHKDEALSPIEIRFLA
jgi:hypothetical protein